MKNNIFNTIAITLTHSVSIMLIVVALLLSFSVAGYSESNKSTEFKTVIAEGVGVSRDEAITDAQRKAVEQGLGLYIKSETLVANMTLISDTILKEVSGFMHTYTVEKENNEDNAGVHRVTIKAKVSLQRLELALDDLYDKLKIPGNPAVIISIEGTKSLPDAEGVNNALTSIMVEKGIKVLDEDQLTLATQRDALRMIRNGYVDAKTIMPLINLSDIIIIGKATAGKVSVITENPVTYSQDVTLDARMISVDNAVILGAKRGKGVGAGFTDKTASEKAEDNAGENYWEYNKLTFLRAILDPCKQYTVKIINCTHDQLSKVNDKLAESRFIRYVPISTFEQNIGKISLYSYANANMLATYLKTSTSIKLEVVSVTNTIITVKVIQ